MATSARSLPAASHEPGALEPLLVFVHIRKTAGTTIRRILYRQYQRRSARLVRNYFVDPERSMQMARIFATTPPLGLRAVQGHMLFWPDDVPWPPGTRFFTFLRDPIERTLSHYFWLRARSARFQKSLDEALVDGSIHDNLQTRVLAASMPPPGETTEQTLERALESLDRFAVVGLTERFDESFVLMTRTFGWRRMLYSTENVTVDRQPREELPPESLALVERHNALDLELYRRAAQRLDQEIARQGDDFQIEVAALQRASARLAAIPKDVSLERLPPTLTGERSSGGSLDLRELLIETQAELLLRDAELERLQAGADHTPARAVPKPRPEPRGRAEALDAATERAKQRIAKTEKQIRALEEAGTPSAAAELDGLRGDLERAQRRLRGFERRRAKLERRARRRRGEDQL